MRKFILPGIMAVALSSASTLALAQSTTETQTPPANQPTTEQPAQSGQMNNQTGTSGATSGDTMKSGSAVGADAKTMTSADAQEWVGKRVYSSDDNDIGEIAALKTGADGNVTAFHADIGGFLGIGESRVAVKPSDLEMRDDKLYLNMTKQEALKLPRVTEAGEQQQKTQ